MASQLGLRTELSSTCAGTRLRFAALATVKKSTLVTDLIYRSLLFRHQRSRYEHPADSRPCLCVEPRSSPGGVQDCELLKPSPLHCVGRVGDARPDIDVGMNSFDPSAVDISLLGHNYIGASRSVLADFGELILDNRSPDRRFGVLSKGQPPKQWWVLIRQPSRIN